MVEEAAKEKRLWLVMMDLVQVICQVLHLTFRLELFEVNSKNLHFSTKFYFYKSLITHCTEVHFASFLSGGFITAIVVNPPERKLAKRTTVHCSTAVQCSAVKVQTCADLLWQAGTQTAILHMHPQCGFLLYLCLLNICFVSFVT